MTISTDLGAAQPAKQPVDGSPPAAAISAGVPAKPPANTLSPTSQPKPAGNGHAAGGDPTAADDASESGSGEYESVSESGSGEYESESGSDSGESGDDSGESDDLPAAAAAVPAAAPKTAPSAPKTTPAAPKAAAHDPTPKRAKTEPRAPTVPVASAAGGSVAAASAAPIKAPPGDISPEKKLMNTVVKHVKAVQQRMDRVVKQALKKEKTAQQLEDDGYPEDWLVRAVLGDPDAGTAAAGPDAIPKVVADKVPCLSRAAYWVLHYTTRYLLDFQVTVRQRDLMAMILLVCVDAPDLQSTPSKQLFGASLTTVLPKIRASVAPYLPLRTIHGMNVLNSVVEATMLLELVAMMKAGGGGGGSGNSGRAIRGAGMQNSAATSGLFETTKILAERMSALESEVETLKDTVGTGEWRGGDDDEDDGFSDEPSEYDSDKHGAEIRTRKKRKSAKKSIAEDEGEDEGPSESIGESSSEEEEEEEDEEEDASSDESSSESSEAVVAPQPIRRKKKKKNHAARRAIAPKQRRKKSSGSTKHAPAKKPTQKKRRKKKRLSSKADQ